MRPIGTEHHIYRSKRVKDQLSKADTTQQQNPDENSNSELTRSSYETVFCSMKALKKILYPVDGKKTIRSPLYYLSLLRASSLFLHQIYFYLKTTGCSVEIYQPASCPMIAFPLSCF
jgi:hypothetical protein